MISEESKEQMIKIVKTYLRDVQIKDVAKIILDRTQDAKSDMGRAILELMSLAYSEGKSGK